MSKQEITPGWWLIWSEFWEKHIVGMVDNNKLYIPGHNESMTIDEGLGLYKFIRKLDLEALANDKLLCVAETVYGEDESKADLEKRIRAEYE